MTKKEKKEEGRMKREEERGERRKRRRRKEEEKEGRRKKFGRRPSSDGSATGVIGGGRKNGIETRMGKKGSSGVLEPYSVEKMGTGEEEEEGKEEEEEEEEKKKRKRKARWLLKQTGNQSNFKNREEKKLTYQRLPETGRAWSQWALVDRQSHWGTDLENQISKKNEGKGRKEKEEGRR